MSVGSWSPFAVIWIDRIQIRFANAFNLESRDSNETEKFSENAFAPPPYAVLAFVIYEYASFQVLSYGAADLGTCRSQLEKGAGVCSSSAVLIWSTVTQSTSSA